MSLKTLNPGSWLAWRRRRRLAGHAVVDPWAGPALVPAGSVCWLKAVPAAFGGQLIVDENKSVSGWGDEGGDWDGWTAWNGPVYNEFQTPGKLFGAVSFDGVDDEMVPNRVLLPAGSSFSIFAVWRPGNYGPVSSFLSGTGEDFFKLGSNGDSIDCYCGNFTFGFPFLEKDWFCIDVRIAPGMASTRGYVNGIASAEVPGGGTTAPGGVTMGMGGYWEQSDCGDLAELIIYDRVLSEDEAWKVRRYLQGQYNFLRK